MENNIETCDHKKIIADGKLCEQVDCENFYKKHKAHGRIVDFDSLPEELRDIINGKN